jgi:DNA polymerase-1
MWGDRLHMLDIHQLVRELEAQKEIAIDTETTGLVTWKDYPLYFSLAWGQKRCTVHASLLEYFRGVFADPYKRWILANAKFDMHMLANRGMFFAGSWVDTQVEHALLYEEQPHGLKEMAGSLLGWKWRDFQDTFGKITKAFTPQMLMERAERENFPLLVEYAANDAWGTLNVHLKLKAQLQSALTHSLFRTIPPYIETLDDYFEKIERPYSKVLWKNERNGILVNMPYLEQCKPVAEHEIAKVGQQLAQIAGRLINPNSTPDLRAFLIDELGLQPLKMTTGGKSGVRMPSVDEKFLDHIAEYIIHGHEQNASELRRARDFCQVLLKHRSYSKLYGTYLCGLSEVADPYGRIHTRFNQDVARTGRLSSAGPNLQNIPTPDNDKWNIRNAFIAQPGHELIVADYEQLEMRLLACASLERDMISIFLKGWDIHMGNATLVFGIPYEELKAAKDTEKMVKKGKLPESAMTARVHECLSRRQDVKAIGFGLNYGMGANKLAVTLNCTPREAQNKIDQYMNTYPAVKRFYAEAIENARKTDYAYTIAGRRRAVPEINSSRNSDRNRAERVAVNLEIQGSAADAVKMAQVALDKERLDERYGCRSILQVHDELVHEVPSEYAELCMREIQETMEHPFFIDLAVPLAVSIGRGESWAKAK